MLLTRCSKLLAKRAWGHHPAVARRAFATQMTPATQRLVDGILKGDRVSLSRGITLIESTLATDSEQAELLLNKVLDMRREKKAKLVKENRKDQLLQVPSFRLGIAGPPGAGKSTFIEAFGLFLTKMDKKVAVLAIDPSSTRSGGSLLGDKTRMVHLSNDDNAFVRPSPTKGTLGGVAQNTNDVVLLCEAAGYEYIIVESVGLGQSEIVIDDTVDMVMLLVPPANGDELQGSKKGIMEIADIVVVNKADGELKSAAKHTAVDYMHGLHYIRQKDPDWMPQVKLVSARESMGLDKVYEVICQFRSTMNEFNKIAAKRNVQSSKWMWSNLQEQLMTTVLKDDSVMRMAKKMKHDLVQGYVSPRTAAKKVMKEFLVHWHAKKPPGAH